MKEILLSKSGKNSGKYTALVDDEDFEKVNCFNWSIHRAGCNIYALRSKSINGKKSVIMMHSFVLGIKYVDHIDGNTLNNQKNNLRQCTVSENMMNRKSFKNSSSKYKGVYVNSNGRKYCAQITKNGNQIYLGTFPSEIDAALAYDKKAIELFG